VKTRLVQIGNSRGVRLPKAFIEQAGLTEEVELEIQDGSVVISAVRNVRAGWRDAAENLAHREEDILLDDEVPTRFEEEEWEW